jgi:hypothetical protein
VSSDVDSVVINEVEYIAVHQDETRTVEIAQTSGVDSVVINEVEYVVVHQTEARTVEVLTIGPPGPRGLDGGTGLGGIPTQFQDMQPGDLLMFNGSSWTNENKTQISDGGNF